MTDSRQKKPTKRPISVKQQMWDLKDLLRLHQQTLTMNPMWFTRKKRRNGEFSYITLVACVGCVILIMNMLSNYWFMRFSQVASCVNFNLFKCSTSIWELNIDNLAFFFHIVLFSFHTDWDIPDRSIRFLIFFSSRSDVPEGLFLATTSSIVAFVEDFNQFFKCASNSGKCKGMFSDYWRPQANTLFSVFGYCLQSLSNLSTVYNFYFLTQYEI